MTEIIFVLLYLLAVLWLERCHRAERRELYDRISFDKSEDYVKLREKKKRQMPEPPYIKTAKKWRSTKESEHR